MSISYRNVLTPALHAMLTCQFTESQKLSTVQSCTFYPNELEINFAKYLINMSFSRDAILLTD